MNYSLIIFGVLFHLCANLDAARDWKAEVLATSITSTDESLINATMTVISLGIGENVLSGFIDWKYDVDETTMTQLILYSCQSGRENDYRELPYSVPRIPFYDFLNKYYMKVLYPDFGVCSNLPVIEGKFVPPWNKTTYIFNNCKVVGVGFPDIMPYYRYYRIVYKVEGPAVMTVTIDAKLSPKVL